MGWARAELIYEQFKGREDITPLQYRLMLLIHLKKQKIRLRELEILSFSSLIADNRKAVEASFNSYTEMVFPGGEKKAKEESFEQKAKRQLAEEAKKVYVVRRRDENKQEEYLKNIAKSSDPNIKALAARELKEHARQEARRMNAKNRFKSRKKQAQRRGIIPSDE